jgi:hypothetical protein
MPGGFAGLHLGDYELHYLMLVVVFACMFSLRHTAEPVRGSLGFAPMRRGVVAVHHATEPQDPEALELAFIKRGNSDKAGNPERPAWSVCLGRCAASSGTAGLLNLRCNRIAGCRYLTGLGNRALYVMVKAVSSRGREDTGQEISCLRHGGLCRLAGGREPLAIGHGFA